METGNWPRMRYRTSGDHGYRVEFQLGPRASWYQLGTVRRFGSLPSMRGWQATAGGEWTRKRDNRADATMDLIEQLAGPATPGRSLKDVLAGIAKGKVEAGR